MLPLRLFLINQQAFKAVLKFEVKPVGDALQLDYTLNQFTGALTESIIQSIDANPTNLSLFKALPTECVFSNSISLTDSEKLYVCIQQLVNQNTPSSDAIGIDLYGLRIYLPYQILFAINSFIMQFVSTYEMMRMNLAVLQQNQESQQPKISNVDPNNSMVSPQDINQEEVIEEPASIEMNNADNSILLNETLKLSPNHLATYYISKYVCNIVNTKKCERVDLTINEATATIMLSPLIDQQLIEICDKHYANIVSIVNSFEYSQDEYISKLKMLVRQLV